MIGVGCAVPLSRRKSGALNPLPGGGLAGSPIGLLLALTYASGGSSAPPPTNSGTPVGLLLAITNP